jgi:hypothetical protein
MKLSFTMNEKEGLTGEDIKAIKTIVDDLLKQYPNIIIAEVGDFYTKDKNDDFYKKYNYSVTFDSNGIMEYTNLYIGLYKNKSIYVNHKFFYMQSTVSYEEEVKQREISYLSGKSMFGCGGSLNSTLWHEFAHAIADQCNLCNNIEINYLFNNLPKDYIHNNLSEYASVSIGEFIAEGFTESTFKDCRPLGKLIKVLIDSEYKKYFSSNSLY